MRLPECQRRKKRKHLVDSPWTKSTSGWFCTDVFSTSQHLGGESAILTPAGKDAAVEFDRIHPPDVVKKYTPDAVIGTLGDGGEDDDDEEDDSSEGARTMEEVAKHNKKGDVWVVLNGGVLNVSNFLSRHPGGELAILTFAGKDATAEFDMIHQPDVVEKSTAEFDTIHPSDVVEKCKPSMCGKGKNS